MPMVLLSEEVANSFLVLTQTSEFQGYAVKKSLKKQKMQNPIPTSPN